MCGRVALSVVCWGLLAGSLCGCQMSTLFARRDFPSRHQPCVLKPDCSIEDVAAVVNHNVSMIEGWRSTGVEIRANRIPLSADVAVQRDNRLRLMVKSPLAGQEVDIGSNDDAVWFWARRDPQHCVHYASHEDLASAAGQAELPFQPEWLMEALGVRMLDPAGAAMRRSPDGRFIELVSQYRGPHGMMRKVIAVDACQGRVVEHRLYDPAGHPVAWAKFSRHRAIAPDGVVMPHHIDLEWPQAELKLAMTLKRIEINPQQVDPRLWTMPQIAGAPPRNIVDSLAQRSGSQREAVIGSTTGFGAIEAVEHDPGADSARLRNVAHSGTLDVEAHERRSTTDTLDTDTDSGDFLPPVRRQVAAQPAEPGATWNDWSTQSASSVGPGANSASPSDEDANADYSGRVELEDAPAWDPQSP